MAPNTRWDWFNADLMLTMCLLSSSLFHHVRYIGICTSDKKYDCKAHKSIATGSYLHICRCILDVLSNWQNYNMHVSIKLRIAVYFVNETRFHYLLQRDMIILSILGDKTKYSASGNKTWMYHETEPQIHTMEPGLACF